MYAESEFRAASALRPHFTPLSTIGANINFVTPFQYRLSKAAVLAIVPNFGESALL